MSPRSGHDAMPWRDEVFSRNRAAGEQSTGSERPTPEIPVSPPEIQPETPIEVPPTPAEPQPELTPEIPSPPPEAPPGPPPELP